MTKSIKYYLYHIPGKKIGVTRDLTSRVTKQQGYALDEYEVLLTSDDIDYISNKEIELQKSYGYKVDRQPYKHLNKKSNQMNINVTEQTSTFPVPLNKLKGRLLDNMGLIWETPHGTFRVTKDNIPWIMSNARTSMFNSERCYVYNKALSASSKVWINSPTSYPESLFTTEKVVESTSLSVYDKIRTWANDKGIYDKGDTRTQYLKLVEEVGELAEGILKENKPEIIDAIGDIVVVLTNLARLEELRIEDCVDSAYDVIKNRKGMMVNGTFVKQTL